MTPLYLKESDKRNFDTLLEASENNDLALVSTIRKRDQKPVALVCAMRRNGDGTFTPVPLAVMIEGNPYEDFEDPTANEHWAVRRPPNKTWPSPGSRTTRKSKRRCGE